jgi:transposase
MTKGESEAVRQRGYDLYMNTTMTLRDIADSIGVGYDTVGDWCARYKWKQSKAANSITREKNVSMMLVQINTLLTEVNERDKKYPTAAEADTITKLTNNIRALSSRTSLPDFFNVQTEFLKYLHTANDALAKQVADYSKEFLQSKARELDN